MKRLTVVLLLLIALVIGACSGEGAKQVYDTAQFEEKQNNPEHAKALYEEIIKKYPESEFAGKAKERITAISNSAK